jgi:hypothetical protein
LQKHFEHPPIQLGSLRRKAELGIVLEDDRQEREQQRVASEPGNTLACARLSVQANGELPLASEPLP